MSSLIKIGRTYYGKLREADGKIVRYSTGQQDMKKAAGILYEWERRVAQGLPALPSTEEKCAAAKERERRSGQNLSVAALCQRFMEEYRRPKIKCMKVYWGTYGGYIRNGILKAPLGSLKAEAVRKADVERWRDEFLPTRYTPRTVNVVLATLNKVYNWGLDQEVINCRNPVRGVEDVPEGEQVSILSLTQVQQLLRQEAPLSLRARLLTALMAGLRPGELAGLRWQDVHMDADTPYIFVCKSYDGPTKSGKPRAVPLHLELLTMLQSWQAVCPPTAAGLVFPVVVKVRGRDRGRMARGDETHGLPELLKAAGCPVPTETTRRKAAPRRRVWHALRHIFSTRCRDCGIPRDVISELLGHAAQGATVTSTYLHDTPERLQRLAAELRRLWYLPATPAAPAAPATPAHPVEPALVRSEPTPSVEPAAPPASSEPARDLAPVIDLDAIRRQRAGLRRAS